MSTTMTSMGERWQNTALALNDTRRVGSVIPMVRNRNQFQVVWPELSAPQFWWLVELSNGTGLALAKRESPFPPRNRWIRPAWKNSSGRLFSPSSTPVRWVHAAKSTQQAPNKCSLTYCILSKVLCGRKNNVLAQISLGRGSPLSEKQALDFYTEM